MIYYRARLKINFKVNKCVCALKHYIYMLYIEI